MLLKVIFHGVAPGIANKYCYFLLHLVSQINIATSCCTWYHK
jgi:hypothetical protein